MDNVEIRTFVGKLEFLQYIRFLRKQMRPESTGYLYNSTEWGLLSEPDLYYQFFEMLLECIPVAFTVITEECYVEKNYRDTYYQYYSGQHFAGDRFSYRLSFFGEKDLVEKFQNHKWKKIIDELNFQAEYMEIMTRKIDWFGKKYEIKVKGKDISGKEVFEQMKYGGMDWSENVLENIGIVEELTKRIKNLHNIISETYNNLYETEEPEIEKNIINEIINEFNVIYPQAVYMAKYIEGEKKKLIERYAKISKENWYDFENYNTSQKAVPNADSGKKYDAFQDAFIGSCVINPLLDGSIGLTLLDPEKLNFKDPQNGVRYIRRAVFKEEICGRRFEIRAFPFRTQDGQFTRCTEVTLLNLFDYFGTLYSEYRTVLPSEILFFEQSHSSNRVLPASGITYETLSSIIRFFGFSPYYKTKERMYLGYEVSAETGNEINSEKTEKTKGLEFDDFGKYISDNVPEQLEERMHRCLHHYIESGIPVAVGLKRNSRQLNGHSIVCIGHGDSVCEEQKESVCKRYQEITKEKFCFIDSASFYEQYVVMDDGQMPYSKVSFRDMSNQIKRGYSRDIIAELVVPLNKRMISDERTAYNHCVRILSDSGVGLDESYRNNHIILRLFLTSCRSYKAFRTATKIQNKYPDMLKDLQEQYAQLPMPRFVWVCEIYDGLGDYNSCKAFGELVIDATNLASNQAVSSLLLAVYQNRYFFQTNERKTKCRELKMQDDMITNSDWKNNFRIPSFRKNLQVF